MNATSVSTLCAALALPAGPAFSAQQCGGTEAIAAALTAEFGESRQSLGQSHNDTVIEVWASSLTGSWTILVILPTGMTCILAAGEGYRFLQEPAPIPGEPV